MSGHSHWATIRHKKGAADAKKGKLFSKVAKLLMLAAREGGKDPDSNMKLKYAIEKAREANMPKDNIDKAIKKGAGELQGQSLEEVTYEGFAPGGVAVLVDALTDNRNRTISEIRKIFEMSGGSMGAGGSVSYLFQKKGILRVPARAVAENDLMAVALEAGAEDVQTADGTYEITCDPRDFDRLKEALAGRSIPVESSELARVAKNSVLLSGAAARKVLAVLDELEEHEDVQQVSANLEVPEEMIAQKST